jgi:MerR family transcriptional regulator, redox-sensitive transcriptional activator SoxR
VDKLLTIGEVSDRSGVPSSTLRYYDRIGLVHADGRQGGQRRYDPGVLRRLEAIVMFRRSGFSLDEIGALLDGGRPWQRLAESKLAGLQAHIDDLRAAQRLIQATLDCGCKRLDTCDRLSHVRAALSPT